MRSLLFTTWGLHERWAKVKYIPSFKAECEPVHSKNALPLLLKYIEPRLEKVYVFVADTALRSKAESYEEIIKDVEDYYLNFLEELDVRRDLVEFVVAPGTGVVRRDALEGRFEGSLTDYYSYALYKVSKILAEVDDPDLIISLDLTHGINYMPVLIYRALKEALELTVLNRNVDFAVYNSEPYIPGVEELNIHLVERERMSPRIIPQGLNTGKCRLLRWSEAVRKCEEDKELGRKLDGTQLPREMVDELNAFLGSLINGLPLALLTFYPDCAELEKRIDEAVNIWRGEMEITERDGRFTVRRRAALSGDFVKCVRAWLLARILKLSRKDEVSLAELHEVRSMIYSKLENLDSMMSRELNEVEGVARQHFGVLLDTWRRLGEFLTGGGWSDRNFLAHSGLERNVVEIMVRSGEVTKGVKEATRLRYTKSEAQKILNASKRGLRI